MRNRWHSEEILGVLWMGDIKILNALLFDTRSIQKYIFSSNRLSTNIGASFIVDKVFTEILVGEVLTKFFPAENFLL